MKITEVYDGMKDKEIREFLSKEFHKVGNDFASEKYYDKKIARLKEQIKNAQDEIRNTINAKAIHDILTNLGYASFDISDMIEYDPDTYHLFFGTYEEFNKIQDKIEKEKKEKK